VGEGWHREVSPYPNCRSKTHHIRFNRPARAKNHAALFKGKDGHKDIAAVGGWPRYRVAHAWLRMSHVNPVPRNSPV